MSPTTKAATAAGEMPGLCPQTYECIVGRCRGARWTRATQPKPWKRGKHSTTLSLRRRWRLLLCLWVGVCGRLLLRRLPHMSIRGHLLLLLMKLLQFTQGLQLIWRWRDL